MKLDKDQLRSAVMEFAAAKYLESEENGGHEAVEQAYSAIERLFISKLREFGEKTREEFDLCVANELVIAGQEGEKTSRLTSLCVNFLAQIDKELSELQ